MPGILKIGYTMKDPSIRANELNTTGVPHPYNVDYEILVDEPYTLEQKVHKNLEHTKENKEWFRIDIAHAIDVIHTCCSTKIHYERHVKKETEEKYKQYLTEKQNREIKKRIEEEQQKKIKKEKYEQEEIKKRTEKELQKYIEAQATKKCRHFLLWGFIFLVIISALFQNFVVFVLGLFILLFLVPLYDDFTRKQNSHIWTEEFLSNKYPTIPPYSETNIKTASSLAHHQTNIPYTIIDCPHCSKQVRIPSGKAITCICNHCNTHFKYPFMPQSKPIKSEIWPSPKQPEPNLPPLIITCPSCLQKLRVPADKAVMVRCPNCNHTFMHP